MWHLTPNQIRENQIKFMNKLSGLFPSKITPQRSKLNGYFLKIKRKNMTTIS